MSGNKQTHFDPSAALRSLEGESLEAISLADTGTYSKGINTHVHVPFNACPADSTEEVVKRAKEAGARIMGVTNYYSYDEPYRRFCEAAVKNGIFPMYGMEVVTLDGSRSSEIVNDPKNPGRIYVIGKGASLYAAPKMPQQVALIEKKIRENDSERIRLMILKLVDYLKSLKLDFAFMPELSESSIKYSVAKRHAMEVSEIYLQERHLCRAIYEQILSVCSGSQVLVNAVYRAINGGNDIAFHPAEDRVKAQEFLRNALLKAKCPAYVEESPIAVADAQTFVWGNGGLFGYPMVLDNVPNSDFERNRDVLDRNLDMLKVCGVELIPLRNEVSVGVAEVERQWEKGRLVWLGTENNGDAWAPLLPVFKGGVEIPDHVLNIAETSTMVAIGHSWYVANGQPGYAGFNGRLNPEFNTSESRIAHYAKRGRQVVEAFFQNPQAFLEA